MKYLLLLPIVIFYSCSNKLNPGIYKKSNGEEVTIHEDGTYFYSSKGRGVQAVSFGIIKRDGADVIFISDSSGYMKISVQKVFFDPTLKSTKKIILFDSANKLTDFTFSLALSDSIIEFGQQPYISVEELEDIQLYAKFNKANEYAPHFANDSIFSNIISTESFGEWNTIQLNVMIDKDKFMFQDLPTYILKRGKLIKKDWPIFEYEKK